MVTIEGEAVEKISILSLAFPRNFLLWSFGPWIRAKDEMHSKLVRVGHS
jgi:hypothetical protein